MLHKTLIMFCLCAALSAQILPVSSIYFTPGRVLAKGANTRAEGFLKLKSYRIEEVRLAKPVEADVDGKRIPVNRAFRVILTGEQFPVRDLPPFVWAGETRIGPAQESRTLSEVTAVTFDPSLLKEGASLSISFGENGPRQSLSERIQFTEKP